MKLRISQSDIGNTFEFSVGPERSVLLLGRRKICDVLLDSPRVADVHLELRRTPDGWLFKNRATQEPLYWNAHWVTHGMLAEGGVLTFGYVRIEVLSLEPSHLPYASDFKVPPLVPRRRRTWWQAMAEAPQFMVAAIALATALPVVAVYIGMNFEVHGEKSPPTVRQTADPQGDGDARLLDRLDEPEWKRKQREREAAILNLSEAQRELFHEIERVHALPIPDYERLAMLDELRPQATTLFTRHRLDELSLDLRRSLSAQILDQLADIRFALSRGEFRGDVHELLDDFEAKLETSIYHKQIAEGVGMYEDLANLRLRYAILPELETTD